MISSLRVKAELQRSGPQPLVGMSQRFPNKAMVTWREGGGGDGRAGHIRQLPTAQAPRGRLYFPGGTNQELATSSHQGLVHTKALEPRQAWRHSRLHTTPRGHGHRWQGDWGVHETSPKPAMPVPGPVCLAPQPPTLPLHVALAVALPRSHTFRGSLLPTSGLLSPIQLPHSHPTLQVRQASPPLKHTHIHSPRPECPSVLY